MVSRNTLFVYFIGSFLVICAITAPRNSIKSLPLMEPRPIALKTCDSVCDDLPKDDMEPICMMYSRFKKGFHFFVNLCHARKAICKDNILLEIVHSDRCINSNQFFLPIV